eukprot:TRINITY_DN24931_c0_g1_i1.p1 TRINITY_DN24931_c0_g1~~TRINITY_DN24931_c0_g1_i1.p1  ORF type:complete len:1271 (+),score=259.82 TRINITY_DN24931_c0_g1_i1:154-3813(+)
MAPKPPLRPLSAGECTAISGASPGLEDDEFSEWENNAELCDGIYWKQLSKNSAVECQPAGRCHHNLILIDDPYDRPQARERAPQKRVLALGGDAAPTRRMTEFQEIHWLPPRFSTLPPPTASQLQSTIGGDRSGESRRPSKDRMSAASPSSGCASPKQTERSLGGGVSRAASRAQSGAGGYAGSANDTEADRFEWQMPRPGLPIGLKSCSVVALENGLLVVFGGLMPAAQFPQSPPTSPREEGGGDGVERSASQRYSQNRYVQPRPECTNDLRIFDTRKNAWLWVRQRKHMATRSATLYNSIPPADAGGMGGRTEAVKYPLRRRGGGDTAGSQDEASSPNAAERRTDRKATATGNLANILPAQEDFKDEDPIVIDGEAPRPCYEHAALAYRSKGPAMLVHGGRAARLSKAFDHLYLLQITQKKLFWKRIGSSRSRASQSPVDAKDRDHSNVLHAQTRKKAFARRAHTMCLVRGAETMDSQLFVFGGYVQDGDDGRISGDLLIVKLSPGDQSWQVVTNNTYGSAPSARAYHSAVMLGRYMVVFGGLSRRDTAHRDMYLLHTTSLVWAKILSPAGDTACPMSWPSARYGHAAVALDRPVPRGGVAMLVYGGKDDKGEVLPDTFIMSFKTPLAADGEGAGSAPEALDSQPAIVLSSLWERIFENLHQVQSDQLGTLVKQSEDTQELLETVLKKENTLQHSEKTAQLAVNNFHKEQKLFLEAKAKLQDLRKRQELKAQEMKGKIEMAEAKTESLRRRFHRLQLTNEILETGRMLPSNEINVVAEDMGQSASYEKPKTSADKENKEENENKELTQHQINNAKVNYESMRRSGTWWGCRVMVEEVIVQTGMTPGATADARGMSVSGDGDQPDVRKTSRMMSKGNLILGNLAGPIRGRASSRLNNVGQQQGSKSAKQILDDAISKELRIMSGLRHPHLMEFFGCNLTIGDPTELSVVAEPPLMPLRLRLCRVHRDKRDDEEFRKGLVFDAALALEYLHSRGVVHRCIILDHLFARDNGLRFSVKLGGLMLMRVFHRCRCETLQPPSVQKATAAVAASRLAGGQTNATTATLLDRLAQQVQDAKNDKKEGDPPPDPRSQDMYAMGALIIQLLTMNFRTGYMLDRRTINFEGVGGRSDLIRPPSQMRPCAVSGIRDKAMRLVAMKCMEKEPQYRLSAAQIVNCVRASMEDEDAVVRTESLSVDKSLVHPLIDSDLVELAPRSHALWQQ